MQDGRFPIEVVNGVPVAAAPEEIDITNAQELRATLLEAAAHGNGMLVADLTRSTVLADLTKAPADHGTCANMARRAPGGPSKAQPSADAGSTAPQDAAAAHANSAPAAPLTPRDQKEA